MSQKPMPERGYETAKMNTQTLRDRIQTLRDNPLLLDKIPFKRDDVNHPAHYQAGGIECIDVIEAVTQDMRGLDAVATSQVIKYIWRWDKKGGIESLKKAAWYLDRLIASKEHG
jgi:hypothetical protein